MQRKYLRIQRQLCNKGKLLKKNQKHKETLAKRLKDTAETLCGHEEKEGLVNSSLIGNMEGKRSRDN